MWMKDLNVRAEIIKLLHENVGVNVDHLGLSNGLLDMTPKARVIKGQIGTLNFI